MRRSPRLMIALVMAFVALMGYYASRERNPVTGEMQAIGMDQNQEIALGLQSAPQMAAEFGGLDPDPAAQQLVSGVGNKIVAGSDAAKTGYQFHFRLLADPQTVNAFALPGGPIFITRALFDRLQTEGQLAGVLGHEIGHVVGRHSSERIAKDRLLQGLISAVGVAGSDDGSGGQQAAAVASVVGQMVQLRYGREDELQSDTLGVRFISDAGYDPSVLIKVMDILEEASGGARQPEFMSTHPDPGNRRETIQQAINERFPNGVPPNLSQGRPIR